MEAEPSHRPEELVTEIRIALPVDTIAKARAIVEAIGMLDEMTANLSKFSPVVAHRTTRRRGGKSDETSAEG